MRYWHYVIVSASATLKAAPPPPGVVGLPAASATGGDADAELSAAAEGWFNWVESRLRHLGIALGKVVPVASAAEAPGLPAPADVSIRAHVCPLRWISTRGALASGASVAVHDAALGETISPLSHAPAGADAARALPPASGAAAAAPLKRRRAASTEEATPAPANLRGAEPPTPRTSSGPRIVMRHFMIGLAPVSAVVAAAAARGDAADPGDSKAPDAAGPPEAASSAPADTLPRSVVADLRAPLQTWLAGVSSWSGAASTAAPGVQPPALDIAVAYAEREQLMRWMSATGSKPELAELQIQRWKARQALRPAAAANAAGGGAAQVSAPGAQPVRRVSFSSSGGGKGSGAVAPPSSVKGSAAGRAPGSAAPAATSPATASGLKRRSSAAMTPCSPSLSAPLSAAAVIPWCLSNPDVARAADLECPMCGPGVGHSLRACSAFQTYRHREGAARIPVFSEWPVGISYKDALARAGDKTSAEGDEPTRGDHSQDGRASSAMPALADMTGQTR